VADPFAFAYDLMRTLLKDNPEAKTNAFLIKLVGTDVAIQHLRSEEDASTLWQHDVNDFMRTRSTYLIYGK
jgi:hypothetical protein